MNTDFRVNVDFFTHHKTLKLKKRLGGLAVLSLLQLWAYAAKRNPDGDLSDMTPEDIELAAGWDGDDGALTEALIEVGFFDQDDEGIKLHDWAEHNPWVVEADDRSDKARFSRLSKVNRAEYNRLKAAGINAISKEDYERLTVAQRIVDDRLTTVNETPTTVNELATPAPAPAPTPNVEKNKSSPSRARVDEPEFTRGDAARLFKTVQAVFVEIWPEAAATAAVHTDEMLTALTEHVARDTARAGPEFWRDLAQRARASAFLRGEVAGARGFFPGMKFGWFVKPDNIGKILNGDFDDTPATRPRASPSAAPSDVYSQNQETAAAVLAARRQRRQEKEHENAILQS